MIQRSLVLLKPDAVQRGIIGEILHRFERVGLKIIGAKFILPDQKLVEKHYKKDKAWKLKIGGINIKDCQKYGVDVLSQFGTNDPVKIGDIINTKVCEFLLSGPVLAVVFEGVNSVEKIRSLVGPTYPVSSPPGTIRGDFGLESPYTAMIRKRSVYNLIHASGTPEEAGEEISLWFKPEELFSYKRVHEDLYNY